MATLTVGAGQQYSTLAAAVAASHDGDLVQVQSGTYVNDFAEITTKITIQGVGGMAHFVATGQIPNGKGILITDTDVTLDHIELSGVTVSDQNGAGVRYQGGALTITNSYFHDNQNGILGGANAAGTISIDHSEFSHNGSGSGYTHGIYVGAIASLTVDNSCFHDTAVGHDIKSRAASTTITNSRVTDGPTGTASYVIDLPNGGNATIKNNVIEKGPYAQNRVLVSYGEEGGSYANALSVTGNTILNDQSGGSSTGVRNSTSAQANVSGNTIYGLDAGHTLSGAGTASNNSYVTTEPTYSTASPVASPNAEPAYPAGNPAVPNTTVPTYSVTSGTASRLVFNVSEDAYNGDAQFTVEVDGAQVGGVYTATASHASGQSQAIPIDLTLASGSHQIAVNFINDAYGGSSTADRNLYLNSVTLNGQTLPGSAATLALDGTALVQTGTTSAPTTDSLLLVLSEDAPAGGSAQFVVAVDGHQLGGVLSTNSPHVGYGQGFAFSGIPLVSGAHDVAVSFLNAGTGPNAPVFYLSSTSINGQNVAAGTFVTASRGNEHFAAQGNAPASTAGTSSTAPSSTGTSSTGTSSTGTSSTGAGSTGTSSTGAGSTATNTGSGTSAGTSSTGTLVLNVSEDAWQGDAKFTVAVDGAQVGGTYAATAAHASGHSQPVSLQGLSTTAAHDVAITFINDAFGGSASTDRNLYIDSVQFNGAALQGGSATLLSNGAVHVGTATTIGTPTSGTELVLNLSEDAWRGDAQFTVAVDGVQVGGTYTATATHGIGNSQGFIFEGLSSAAHDIAVTFTNDAYGGSPSADRNLYVNSIQYAGATVANGSAALLSNGTRHFSVPASSASTSAAGSSSNTSNSSGLVLNVSENAWQGDAQFNVFVDGAQVGGTYTATATHSSGATQSVAVGTTLSAGPHEIGVSFINHASGGSATTDRALYLDSATLNGQTIAGSTSALNVDGVSEFTTGTAGATSSVFLSMAEDEYNGDAQFTVAVDGKQLGGAFTATALHRAGQSEGFSFQGIPDTGHAHDLAVTFTNDAYGGSPSADRNLYVNAVQLNGQTVAGASATLLSNGTVHFTLPVH